MNITNRFTVPDRLYLQWTTLFLFLLGSQILVNHWLVFIFFAFFLIDWRKFSALEVYILLLFLLSIFASHLYIKYHYGTYGNEDTLRGIINELTMILMMYLLGLSLRWDSAKQKQAPEKKITYLLFGFFIAYTLIVIYSYFAFPLENHTIGKYGMHLYYNAIESIKHIHHSNRLLAPTIAAYSLTMMVLIIPFILFDTKNLKKIGFKSAELLMWLLIAFSALYFATLMGRRITIFVLLAVVLFLFVKSFISGSKKEKTRISILFISILILTVSVLYHYRADISLLERIRHEGVGDSSRVALWKQGWHTMMEYPWGGGGFVKVYAIDGRPHFYGHDAWLDIGKRFGIIPAILMVLFWLLHIHYVVKIARSRQIGTYMKSIILILFATLFANWFIEPIPLSSRSFFFYTIFFLGFMKAFSDRVGTYGQS